MKTAHRLIHLFWGNVGNSFMPLVKLWCVDFDSPAASWCHREPPKHFTYEHIHIWMIVPARAPVIPNCNAAVAFVFCLYLALLLGRYIHGVVTSHHKNNLQYLSTPRTWTPLKSSREVYRLIVSWSFLRRALSFGRRSKKPWWKMGITSDQAAISRQQHFITMENAHRHEKSTRENWYAPGEVIAILR